MKKTVRDYVGYLGSECCKFIVVTHDEDYYEVWSNEDSEVSFREVMNSQVIEVHPVFRAFDEDGNGWSGIEIRV